MKQRSLIGLTVGSGIGFLLLIGLGTWQLERLAWKEALIAHRQAGLYAPPVAPPADIEEARALEFHPVRVSGRFLNDREMPVAAIAKAGEAGFDIVTPFLLPNGTVLLVDRGFVPVARKDSATRPAGEIPGEAEVTGLLRLAAGKDSWFVPDNRPERNEWYTVDPAQMGRAAVPRATVLPYMLDADATTNPGGYPIGGQTVTELPNNHLQYAITWYALSAALAGVYILVVRRRLREKP